MSSSQSQGSTHASQEVVVTLALLGQKMDTLVDDLKSFAVDRREMAAQIQILNMGHERLLTTLESINKQLLDFMTGSSKSSSESADKIKILDARVVLLEREAGERRTREETEIKSRETFRREETASRAKFYDRTKLLLSSFVILQIVWGVWQYYHPIH